MLKYPMLRCLFMLCLLGCGSCLLLRPPSQESRLEIQAAHHPIVTDGVNAPQEDWKQAQPLVLSPWGLPSPPPFDETVQLLHDDTNLYFLFDMVNDLNVTCVGAGRDQAMYEDDCVEVMLMPPGRRGVYYELAINADNMLYDARITSPEGTRETMNVDVTWDATAIRHVAKQEHKNQQVFWTIEVALPWAALGMAGPPTEPWKMNIHRVRPGRDSRPTFYSWRGADEGKPDFHRPRDFGPLFFEPVN